eukprot:9928283-Ditylum_brightwellii.AAC.1
MEVSFVAAMKLSTKTFNRSRRKGAFTPAHLQAEWNYDNDIILGHFTILWEDVTKNPSIVWVHYQAPKANLYVKFGKGK